jgi:hypothetical protein
MRSNNRRRFSFGLTQVAVVMALVFAMAGGAFAAGHYLITSVRQISPNVVKALRGHRGARGKTGAAGAGGRNGTNGTNGQGPAIAVYNDAGDVTSSATDTSFHSIATLIVPAAGLYAATGKVLVQATGGGSGMGAAECVLTAHTTAGGTDDFDTGFTALQNTSTVGISEETMPLEITHSFSGPGTINLSCQQNGLTNGGATFRWSKAKIIATEASSLTNTAVTS